jgi:hypothetical protein
VPNFFPGVKPVKRICEGSKMDFFLGCCLHSEHVVIKGQARCPACY